MHQADPPYEVLTPPRRCTARVEGRERHAALLGTWNGECLLLVTAGEQLRVVWVPESDVDVLWTPWSLALAGTADPSA